MIFGSGLKKINRVSPIKMSLLRTPPELVGAVYFYGRIRCLDEETKIYILDNNLIRKEKIKNLKDNFTVLSYDFKNNKIVYNTAIKQFNGLQEVYDIKFKDGTNIVATSKHKFFNSDGKIEVNKLKKGDKIKYKFVNNKNLNSSTSPEVRKKLKVLNRNRSRLYINKNILYKKIKKYICDGKSEREIVSKVPEIKFRNCKRILEYMDDNKTMDKLKINNKIKQSEGIRNYKLNFQNYDYMRGGRNPAKRLDVRKKISRGVIGEKNGFFGKKHTEKFKEDRRKYGLKYRKDGFFKGHHHTEEAKKRISFGVTGEKNGSFGKVYYSKCKYNKKLKHYIRSSWEENICFILKKYNIDYLYEPSSFKVVVNNKIYSYTPDLFLPKYNLYIEIKGPIFDHQLNKMKYFNKNNNYLVIGSNSPKLKFFNYINYHFFLQLNKGEVLRCLIKK